MSNDLQYRAARFSGSVISQNEEVLSPKIAKAEKGKKIAENRLNELSIA